MFIVVEIQKNGEVTSPITTLFTDKEAAYSQYHTILAAAADWSKQFMSMSAEELDHASKLYKMFAEYVTRISEPYSEQPKYIRDIVNDVNGFYPDMVTKVKMLHEMYR